MLKKLFAVAVLGMGSVGALAVMGCSSNSQAQPNALTGQSVQDPRQDPKNIDAKGHYNPNLAMRNAQARY